MAEEVERSRQIVHRFVSTLSHELRTPLTSIRGYATAVLDGSVSEPDELKRLVSGGRIRLSFTDPDELVRAARTFDGAARDSEALTLQIPSDGGVGSLRALLDRLDADSIEVAGLSVETPDLDDVFLSLTGDTTHEKAPIR